MVIKQAVVSAGGEIKWEDKKKKRENAGQLGLVDNSSHYGLKINTVLPDQP